MTFRDGKTTPIEVERVEWHDSFVACTCHLIDVLRRGGQLTKHTKRHEKRERLS